MAGSSSIKIAARSSARASGRAGALFLIVFGAIFAAAGLGTLALALPDAIDRKESEAIIAASAVGVLFTAIGLGVVWMGFYVQRQGNERDVLKQRHPDSPWMWNPEWASRKIKGSSQAAMIFLWVFAGFWNAISWPIVPKMVEEIERGNRGALFGLLFPLVGIVLLAAAVHATLRARRFGRSTFVLDTLPGVIGGELVGTVRVSKALPSGEGLSVRLVCVNRITTGSGKNSSTREHVLYEEKQEIAPSNVRPGPSGSEIPLQFLVPFDNRDSSDENSRSTINWRIEVTGDFSGIDYFTQFEIPVYKTAASSSDVRESIPPAQSLDEALSGGGPLEGSKIRVTATPSGGVALYFAPARNKGVAFGVSLFAMAWGGVCWLLSHHSDAPLMIAGIFWFFEVLIALGALGLWSSSTRVRAEQSGLTVKSGLFGLGKEKTLPAGEIDCVKIEVGMQQGSKSFYRLRVHHGTKATGCGSGIPEKTEAIALAALLNRALGIDPSKVGG